MLKALARGTRKNLRPKVATVRQYSVGRPGSLTQPRVGGVPARQALINPRSIFSGQIRSASTISYKGGIPPSEVLKSDHIWECVDIENIKKIINEKIAVFFCKDHVQGNILEDRKNLKNREKRCRWIAQSHFSNIILVKGIPKVPEKNKGKVVLSDYEEKYGLIYNDDTAVAENRNMGLSGYFNCGADSYAADGILLIKDDDGKCTVILSDHKRYSASPYDDKQIIINYSSGKNGETIKLNVKKIMDDVKMTLSNTDCISADRIIIQKFIEINKAREIDENTMDKINTALPINIKDKIIYSAVLSTYNFNIGVTPEYISKIDNRYLYGENIHKDDVELPNKCGKISNTSEGVVLTLNSKNVCVPDFLAVESYCIFIENDNSEELISKEILDSIKNAFPGYHIQVDENTFIDAKEEACKLVISRITETPDNTPVIADTLDWDKLYLKSAKSAKYTPKYTSMPIQGPSVNPYTYPLKTSQFLYNQYSTALAAAGINTPKSPSRPMAGGYKCRRTTRRKPRRARV